MGQWLKGDQAAWHAPPPLLHLQFATRARGDRTRSGHSAWLKRVALNENATHMGNTQVALRLAKQNEEASSKSVGATNQRHCPCQDGATMQALQFVKVLHDGEPLAKESSAASKVIVSIDQGRHSCHSSLV